MVGASRVHPSTPREALTRRFYEDGRDSRAIAPWRRLTCRMTDQIPPVGPAVGARHAHEDIGDLWLREPFGRAVMGFVPCLVVLLVGLVILAHVTAAVFSHP